MQTCTNLFYQTYHINHWGAHLEVCITGGKYTVVQDILPEADYYTVRVRSTLLYQQIEESVYITNLKQLSIYKLLYVRFTLICPHKTGLRYIRPA